MQVLREAGLVAADLLERRAPERGVAAPHGRGAAAVHAHRGRAVDVVDLLDRRARDQGVVLVVEGDPALHAGDAGIGERAQHRVQEVGRGDVVDVEDGDELAVGLRQAGVDVSGLGVGMPRAREVADAEAPGERRRSADRASRRAGRCDAGSCIATAARRLRSTSSGASS